MLEQLTQHEAAWAALAAVSPPAGAVAERVRHCLRPLCTGPDKSNCWSSTPQQVQGCSTVRGSLEFHQQGSVSLKLATTCLTEQGRRNGRRLLAQPETDKGAQSRKAARPVQGCGSVQSTGPAPSGAHPPGPQCQSMQSFRTVVAGTPCPCYWTEAASPRLFPTTSHF